MKVTVWYGEFPLTLASANPTLLRPVIRAPPAVSAVALCSCKVEKKSGTRTDDQLEKQPQTNRKVVGGVDQLPAWEATATWGYGGGPRAKAASSAAVQWLS